MPSCLPMTFTGVTQEKYAALLLNAQSQGLALTGTSGSTAFQGMDFTWNYDAPAQALTIQCTEKPIFVPCSMIESKLRTLLA